MRVVAQDNAVRDGVAERIKVRHSDVFTNVDGAFDLIIFDPPFRWFALRDLHRGNQQSRGHVRSYHA